MIIAVFLSSTDSPFGLTPPRAPRSRLSAHNKRGNEASPRLVHPATVRLTRRCLSRLSARNRPAPRTNTILGYLASDHHFTRRCPMTVLVFFAAAARARLVGAHLPYPPRGGPVAVRPAARR